jgi:antitoxin CptB
MGETVQGMLAMETPEARLKRMSMRSWRRGMKEMDLILGPYSDAHLAAMSDSQLLTYDQLLEESDQDLLPWILAQRPAPAYIVELIAEIGIFARARLARA